MDTIEFRDTEVVFSEETFGGLNTAELTVPYENLGEYKIHLDLNDTVNLERFITNADGEGLKLNLTALQTAEAEIHKVGSEETEKHDQRNEMTTDVGHTARSNMPPIPDDAPLETSTDEIHYQRLVNNPDSQPAKYRRLIRSEGKIPRPKFDRWTKRQGFEPEKGGSHNASLLVLERIGEIERRGRGDDQLIVWVGK